MYVSPQKASFKKSMRGYRAGQVDAYIETLCTDFVAAEEDYQSRITMLEKEIDRLQKELEDCRTAAHENAALREELAHLRRRRIRFTRAKATNNTASTDASIKKQANRERTERFFAAGAELVRIVGKTGRSVSRIVAKLPTPAGKPATVKQRSATPSNVKDAKLLLKTLSKQEKAAKRTLKQNKKAAKIMRRVENKQKKLLKKV